MQELVMRIPTLYAGIFLSLWALALLVWKICDPAV